MSLIRFDRNRYPDLWHAIVQSRNVRADLERFEQDIRAEERDGCALECDQRADSGPPHEPYAHGWVRCAAVCADAIRRRGK